MWGTADASLPVTNSVRGILKKFMPRDLTQHYTTVKNTGKLVFCKTKFYSCVQGTLSMCISAHILEVQFIVVYNECLLYYKCPFQL